MESVMKKAAAGILALALAGSLFTGWAAGAPETEPPPADTVEAAVIFAQEGARLNELIFRDGSDDLCQYVKSVLQQLQLADSEFLIDDL